MQLVYRDLNHFTASLFTLSFTVVLLNCNDAKEPVTDSGPDKTSTQGLDQGEEQRPDDFARGDALSGTSTWIRTIDLNEIESVNSLAITPEGMLLAGDTFDKLKAQQIWLLSVANDGQIRWQRQLGGEGPQLPGQLKVLKDHLWVTGQIAGAELDAWVGKLTMEGELSWGRSFSGADSEGFSAVVPMAEGVLLVGDTASYGQTSDLWAARLGLDGAVLWQRRFGTPGQIIEQCSAATAFPGGVVVVGTTVDFNTSNLKGLVLALDEAGEVLWQKTLDGPALDRVDAVVTLADGLLLIGSTRSAGAGGADGWLVHLGFDGERRWGRTLGGAGDDWLSAGASVADGVLVAGRTESFGATDSDIWLVKLSLQGEVQWGQRLGLEGFFDSVADLAESDGAIFLAGFTEDDLDGESDLLVARLDAQGQVDGECSLVHPIDLLAMASELGAQPGDMVMTPTDTPEQDALIEAAPASGAPLNLCPQ